MSGKNIPDKSSQDKNVINGELRDQISGTESQNFNNLKKNIISSSVHDIYSTACEKANVSLNHTDKGKKRVFSKMSKNANSASSDSVDEPESFKRSRSDQIDDEEDADFQDTVEYFVDDDDDESIEDNASTGFMSDGDELDNNISQKQTPKEVEFDFTVLTEQTIKELMKKDSQQVGNVLGIPEEHAATLLRHTKWNKDRLLEQFMDNKEELLKAAGVITDTNYNPQFICLPNFICDLCCNEGSDIESFALSCGHRFCKNCYRQYIVQKVEFEGESRKIQCPENCSVIVDEKAIAMIVPKPSLEKYHKLILKTYVDDMERLRWCTAPNCDYVISCQISKSLRNRIVPVVQCKCAFKLCFWCGLSDHQPVLCPILSQWMKKCKDDSETANWISANTKECLHCNSTIEKNGGCNHMTCKKCKYEFCWVCMGPWKEHGTSWYNCNRFDEKTSVDARDAQAKSRQALERYLHYYNRYSNHEHSAKLDRDLYQRTERKMEEMQKKTKLSWIEVQFLKKAVDILVECRMTLKYTYVLAYYLKRNNITEMFENNQRDLEMAVEGLSELLELPIDPNKIPVLRQQVLDKSVYVNSRRDILLKYALQQLRDNGWEYNEYYQPVQR